MDAASARRSPLFAKEGAPPPPSPVGETRPHDETDLRAERVVRCNACGHVLARERDRLPLETSTFVNPAGVVFHIAAFREANGCAVAGDPTTYWTWFPGHAWRYALCGACRVHLGWQFSGASTFFGLLVDRIAQ
jgi:hypothetical protein